MLPTLLLTARNNLHKNTFHLPRHSSFMIMHTFADWGRVRHNRAESLGITTVSTTKAHGRIGVNAKVWGEILSSNELLTGNVIELVTMKMRKKYKNYCNFSEFEYTICNRVARSLLDIGDQAESCAQLFYVKKRFYGFEKNIDL